MPQIMKDIVAWAGAIAAISGALAIIIKPIRSWFWYVFKKKCGITEIEKTNSALAETICGLKEEIESLHEKIDSLLDMETNQNKAQCDAIRGMMLQTYYKYLPYEAIPSYEAEQFGKLAEDYEKLGGNSFMTNTVIPAVQKWNVITDMDYFNGVK